MKPLKDNAPYEYKKEMESKPTPKFICDKCDYKCDYPAHWAQHIESAKHLNDGKRQPRCDKILDPHCSLCDYKTNNSGCMKTHQLTKHSTVEERKQGFKFYCDKCDFGTFAEILFTRHLETKKHIS
jgi:hypothetical protein